MIGAESRLFSRWLLVIALPGTALLARPLDEQANTGWVLDSVIDRATGEVVLQATARGDKIGTFKPGSAILTVSCPRRGVVVVGLISVYLDMFTVSHGTVTLTTRYDDGPEVAEVWPFPKQALPMETDVEGPAAWALARTLAKSTKFSVTGNQSETFHIPNKEVLRTLLARCAPARR